MTCFYFYYNIPEDCAFITLRKSKSTTHKHYSLAFLETCFVKKNAHLINKQRCCYLITLSLSGEILSQEEEIEGLIWGPDSDDYK